jgi:hypothetical protein
MANILLNEVLHPRFKMFYFTHHKWLQPWIDNALKLIREIWTVNYKPAPISKSHPLAPIPAPSITSSRPKKSHVDFNIMLDYGESMAEGADALEEYLKDLPLPQETDPISYWLKQWKAGEAMDNPSKIALAQMALDYLSVPGLFFCSFIHS